MLLGLGLRKSWQCLFPAALMLLLLFPALFPAFAGSRSPSNIIDHSCVDSKGKIVPLRYLDAARNLKCYFGHQSVGGNILEGLENLAAKEPVRYKLGIVESPPAGWFKANTGLGHDQIGENGQPESKVRDFAARLRKRPAHGANLDLALMKICFVDISPDTDVKKVWGNYLETMQSLKKEFPNLKLVFCTCPIVSTQDNNRREQFNNEVRTYCKKSGDLLFDIADIESYTPQGALCQLNSQRALCRLYSEDNEHPDSPAGKKRLALAWWWLMARAAGWNP